MPPYVRFETKIYHCNINDDGKICHQLLNDSYSHMVSMSSILNEICEMMISPNFDDALDSLKASLYKKILTNTTNNGMVKIIWIQRVEGN